MAPECRIVYVDNDPIVLTHARALLTSTPEGATDYLDADLRNPDTILQQAARTLDFTQPIAIMLMGILGHIADDEQAQSIVKRLVDGVPAGSYLTMNDGTDTSQEVVEAARIWNQSANPTYHLRSPARIARFFDGLELVEPGVVSPTMASRAQRVRPCCRDRFGMWRRAQALAPAKEAPGGPRRRPAVGTPVPTPSPTDHFSSRWAASTSISRLLWRSPNDAGASCAPIRRAAITVTEPMALPLSASPLRTFVK